MAKKQTPSKKPSSFQWRPFLKKLSRELLKDVSIREDLPEGVVSSSWLGYHGAPEEEIARLEKRLGKTLPPSYRTFLATTNGWRNCGAFIYKMWPCSEVRWFRERNQDWIDTYVNPDLSWDTSGAAAELPPLTDEEYLVYGDEQDSCKFRTGYLQAALEISDCGDSAILLLNPEIINDEGEWEAWFFANWAAGAHRYRSFRELMQAEYESVVRLQRESEPSKSKYGNHAQQAARQGKTTQAIEELRKLAAEGDLTSTISLAELCAFQGHWNEVIMHLGQVIRELGAIANVAQYPAHLLLLLARAGDETKRWTQIADLADAAIVAEQKKPYDEFHEHVRDRHIGAFETLKAYCASQGRAVDILNAPYTAVDPLPIVRLEVFGSTLSDAEKRAYYEDALTQKHAVRLKDKPTEYAIHRFGLARNVGLDDEMIRAFEEAPQVFPFDWALEVSRAYMRTGKQEAAWEVIQAKLHESVTLPEQVAPIVLLVDPILRPLMTRERCDVVLATPRGVKKRED